MRRSLALCVMVGAFASAAAAGATGNVLGGVLLGLVAFVTTAFVLDLATGAAGLRGPVRRTVALGLAIWSHGPAPGKSSDGCFPARARAFERYLRGDDV